MFRGQFSSLVYVIVFLFGVVPEYTYFWAGSPVLPFGIHLDRNVGSDHRFGFQELPVRGSSLVTIVALFVAGDFLYAYFSRGVIPGRADRSR